MRKKSGIVMAVLVSIAVAIVGFSPLQVVSASTSVNSTDDYAVRTVTFTGADGVELPGHVLIPNGPVPESGFPVIVFIHSWDLFQIEYVAQEAIFAKAGYITCAYDTRGWGMAEGRIGTAGPLEMQDLSLVIDWLIENTPADPERIGITGVSYGGGHSLLAPAFDDRIKAVVALDGWSSLCDALLTGDGGKWFWAVLLVYSASLMGRIDMEQWKWLLSYQFSLPTLMEETYNDFLDRSPIEYVDKINEHGTAMFIINGINDDLFTSGQITRFYEALKVPKKLTLANGIHATSDMSGLLFMDNEQWKDAKRWFDHWLKGEENGIMEEPPVKVYQNWDHKMGEYEDWPPATEELTLYLNEGRALTKTAPAEDQKPSTISNSIFVPFAPATSGIPAISPLIYSYLKIPVPGAPEWLIDQSRSGVRFEANIEDTITILGAPTLKLWVVPSKSEFQANVFFYDVDQKGGSELIGHTTYTKRNAKPGEEQLVTFDTNVISHQLKGGHKFRIVITTADILWVMPLSNNFDLDILYEPEHASSITLPLIEAPEAPSDSEILPSLMSYPTYFILGILSLAYPLIFAGITALDITMMIWPTLQLIIGPLLEGLLGVVWVFTAPIFTLLLQPEVIDLLGSLVGLAVEVLAPIIQVTYVLLESLLELMGKPPYP